ncbi:hypothetical protein OG874_01430 [Nocardia sp. NBC_00565]|uniref:hypothetical protein n=1 Tax=Nocardia sp. NBC_00565 TaxID=2975993 RepID=UPI002E822BB9|nr:hypothetical protein [Nocardia sp. NBC_00565]WUC03908.1 hypothetical protein OG874_01430 [Nocardia sp. NBC_00565]
MTSDLPFDSDDTEAGDRAGDTAYRVATGVARVARAGAYVTGGALIAANGGTAPATPGGQRLDSWTSAYTRDPDADLPSPVVTFPDPDPNSVPPAPIHSPSPTPRDVAVSAPIPGAPNVGIYIGPAPQQHMPQRWQDGAYGNGYQPGLGLESEQSGFDLHSETPQSGLDLGTGHPSGGFGGLPGLDLGQGGFGLPGHGLGQDGHGFSLPGPNGFLAPGSNPFALPRIPVSGTVSDTALSEPLSSDADSEDSDAGAGTSVPFFGGNMFHPGATGGSGALFHGADAFHGTDAFQGADAFHDGDMYHGVGNPDAFGVFLDAEASFSVHTELEVGFGVGPNGMYLATQSKVEVNGALKVEVGAGRVGDNIDQFSDWLGHTPGTTGRSGLDYSGTSSNTTVGTQPAGGSVPQYSAVAQPVVVQPAQPFAAPLPAAIAPVVAPVAAVAPAIAPAAAVAAPVAATPLQTTIQPDAASTPVANVLVAPPGPSPLTAPAAMVPALFEPRPAPPKPVVVDDSHSTTTPLTTTPTTVTKTVPIPTVPADHSSGHPTKTPDTGITKTPGAGTTTLPGTDVTGTTKTPVTQAPTTHAPTTNAPSHTTYPTPSDDDDDVTTPSAGHGGATTPSSGHGGGTTPSTVDGGTTSAPTTHTQPSADIPTADSPEPTVSVPTHSAPTGAPTIDIDVPTAQSPAPVPTQAPVPTHVPAPTMPNPVPIKPHPIAADLGDPADFTHSVFEPDHSALMAGGLSAPLLPDAIVDDGHHLVWGLDIALI